MTELIFASKNEGKVREFREFLTPLGITVRSLNELVDVPIIVENGTTFAENALIKARTIAATFQQPVIADDAGLVVDALNGAPGIYSARYAGDHDDQANNTKLLKELNGVVGDDRSASFYSVIVAVKPNTAPLVATGSVAGRILEEARGDDGFGYDPLFFYEPMQRSFAELSASEKNAVSHRGNALRKFMKEFSQWWEEQQ